MTQISYLSVFVVLIGSTAALQSTSSFAKHKEPEALTPTASCESWCEVDNCAWANCLDCAICQAEDAPKPPAVCKSWCEADICDLDLCLGCAMCQTPDSLEVPNASAAPVVPEFDYHRAAGVPRGECTHKLKPSLLFIGQAYSGSTSLSEQMALHPELSVGKTKEHQYFKANYQKIKSEERYEKYLNEFWVSCNTTVAYDATMDYLQIAMGTGEEGSGRKAVNYIRQRLGGKLKIMAMIRDPVDLLFHKKYCNIEKGSSLLQPRPFKTDKPWNMTRQDDRPTRTLETWMKVYPEKKNWLFLDSLEYFANPQKTLDKVFKFAGVKPFKLSSTELDVASGRRRCRNRATSEERSAFWSSKDNQEEKTKLEKITGLKFGWKRK